MARRKLQSTGRLALNPKKQGSHSGFGRRGGANFQEVSYLDSEIILMAAALLLGMPLVTALLAIFSEKKPAAAASRPITRDSHGAAILYTTALWGVLTALGLWWVSGTDFFPTVGSDKGEEIRHAFEVLTLLAVPVFMMVIAIMAYALVRNRDDDSGEDGLPLEGKGAVPGVWLCLTAALTLLVIVYPGLTSLDKVISVDRHPDLVIDVEGLQWTWLVSYPDAGVSNQREIVLPVDKVVKFNLTSRDVLHSFWIPSLMMKTDVVPGRTISLSLRPTELGDFESDPLVRLQCAELCGIGHSSMRINVRVVSQQEFDAWLREKRTVAP